MEIQIQWFGPFVFVPQPKFDCVFDQHECDVPGLYLWTIKPNGGYLVNYVGEGGCGKNGDRNLRVRLEENVRHSYAGKDKYVTKPEQFRRGLSGESDRVKFETIRDFLTGYSTISSMIHENFCSYRVFIAPATKVADNSKLADNEVCKYIEKGIIRTLDAAENSISKFLANKERYKNARRSQTPISVVFKKDLVFHGLEGLILC
ncbi:MAG: hypothetical protein ABSA26_13605 [Thermoguttaceae bacterium]